MEAIITLIIGGTISILTMYFNNKAQFHRDELKLKNDRIIENEKRQFEINNYHRDYLLKSIEEVHCLLIHFEYQISLTKSVIDSSKKLNFIDFDLYYENEIEKLSKLKSITLSRFPNHYDQVVKIDNLYNNYWGHQRLLLQIDVKNERENYSNLQGKIIEISNRTNEEMQNLIYEFKKHSNRANEGFEITYLPNNTKSTNA